MRANLTWLRVTAFVLFGSVMLAAGAGSPAQEGDGGCDFRQGPSISTGRDPGARQ